MTTSPGRAAPRRASGGTGRMQRPRLKLLVWLLLCAVPVYGALTLWLRDGLALAAALYVGASLLAFLLYRHDKHRAGNGGWRIPEKWLHGTELLGGWPGALLAQQLYRHKTSKRSYQWVFWLIVLVHQVGWASWVAGVTPSRAGALLQTALGL